MSDWRTLAADLFVEYAWLLDNDRLEDWVQLFVEEGEYRIVPRDNFDQGGALALLSCRNRAMIRDRVLALRVANEYDIHYARHLIAPARLTDAADDAVRFQANYLVMHTDQGGNSRPFSTGCYHGRLGLRDRQARILELTVVIDTFCVQSLIATPL